MFSVYAKILGGKQQALCAMKPAKYGGFVGSPTERRSREDNKKWWIIRNADSTRIHRLTESFPRPEHKVFEK